MLAPRTTVHGRKAVILVARWQMAAFHHRPEERHISVASAEDHNTGQAARVAIPELTSVEAVAGRHGRELL